MKGCCINIKFIIHTASWLTWLHFTLPQCERADLVWVGDFDVYEDGYCSTYVIQFQFRNEFSVSFTSVKNCQNAGRLQSR